MAKQTTKQPKSNRPGKRLSRTPQAAGDSSQPTWVFWDFMREFDQAYLGEVQHNHWLVKERRFAEVAIHALRRLLRTHGVDVVISRRPPLAPRHRSAASLDFKIALNTKLAREYGRDLRGDSKNSGAITGAFIEGSEAERFVRAFQAVFQKYGFEFSPTKPLPKREQTLIQLIDSLLPVATRQRYRELSQRTHVASNLCYACSGCNGAKATGTVGFDSVSSREVRLYHPRRDRWLDHFAWSEDHCEVVPLTAIGRVMLLKLRLNRPNTVEHRRILRDIGRHLPTATQPPEQKAKD